MKDRHLQYDGERWYLDSDSPTAPMLNAAEVRPMLPSLRVMLAQGRLDDGPLILVMGAQVVARRLPLWAPSGRTCFAVDRAMVEREMEAQ